MDVTQTRLRELFSYSPETRLFTRRVRTAWCTHVGDVIGGKGKDGKVLKIGVDGAYYTAHRLAHLYEHGEWPERAVFIDRVPAKVASESMTVGRLHDLFSLDPDTGVLTQRVRVCQRVKAGDTLGCKSRKGYLQVRVDGKSYKVSRIIWMYATGCWPTDQIDHRNGVRHDNCLANLREGGQTEQNQNQHVARSDSHTKEQGVGKHGSGFRARIVIGDERYIIGQYATRSEASEAYQLVKAVYHPFAKQGTV